MKTTLLLVCNRAYLKKALTTIIELRTIGRYWGKITLLVGDDLRESIPLLERLILRIRPIYMPDIDRSRQLAAIKNNKGLSGIEISKGFQYHKMYVFHSFFKAYERVLYLDAGMRVMHPIQPILQLDCSKTLRAHSDSFPDYAWTLGGQFNFLDFPEKSVEIAGVVELESDYFQTTLMLYDTSIIEEKTFEYLTTLLDRFPNSRTNEQGIMNLWALPRKLWTPLEVKAGHSRTLYDFHERPPLRPQDYILLKYPRARRLRKHLVSDTIADWYWRTVARRLP